ncbi:unnamed protein product [Symbiodinium natans]|uniref:RNase H type-1 domain-containing protein n=1 Tax=Symbiodinium natans TaxID=878477 RepID=A0A812TKE0_9DINO|nr:unnamed protein product [Symbiodinium natans]
MHQDGLSERFCGEGVPLWAVPKEHTFPLPLGLPYRGQGNDGLPTRSQCAKHMWYTYQAAYASGAAYERLYTNQDNLTDAWGAFWAKVLQSFKGSQSLLGVNIINEPFVGNPYKDPALMVPEAADRLRLQPAYDIVARHIRAADPDSIIFFPGTTSDRTGRPYTDFLPQGFQHAPGGKEFADRAVNSFHYYTPPQSDSHVKQYFQKRIKDARRLETGLFLTESCCEKFFHKVAPVAESLGMSWIHWEWKQFFRETEASRTSPDQNAAFGADKTGCGGLWVIPPECAKLQEALEALPPPAHNVFFEEHICLFTDGSTYDSTGIPRSAWAVVCTREGSLDNAIVESACLCGKQSNPRAELTAVLVAFQHAVTADIYSDALGVVRGVRRLLREGWRYKYWGKQVNLDLWWLAWQQIFSKPGPWKIFHVKSHSDHRMAVDQFSKWTFWHNAAADEAAKAAHLKRSVELNQCFEQASAAAASQRHAAAKLFAFHEGVVKQAGGDENPQVLSVGGLGFGVGGDGQIDLIRDLGGVQVQTCVQPLLEFDDCLMGPRFLWVLQKFFLSQSWKQTQSPVSVLEIYLEFVAQTGWIAPANTAKMESATLPLRHRNSIPSSWVHESEYPALKLCRPALGKQVAVFLHAIKELFKRTQAEHSVVQEKALSVIGLSRRVPALYICPMTIDAQAIRLKSVIGSDKYDLVVKRP